jgi:hypothetical protein
VLYIQAVDDAVTQMSRSSGESRITELLLAVELTSTQSIHTDPLIQAVVTENRLKNKVLFSNLVEARKFGIKFSNLQSLVL